MGMTKAQRRQHKAWVWVRQAELAEHHASRSRRPFIAWLRSLSLFERTKIRHKAAKGD